VSATLPPGADDFAATELAADSRGRPLRILIHGINFAPELTGVGKYTGEMAAWLAAQGHTVRVVTAPPYYPAWSVFEGYHPRLYKRDPWQGVHVWRCPLWVPTRLNGLTRLIHLASFALSSLPMMLRHISWKPDVVWVVEPALMCAPAALITAKLSGAKAWLHVQDFEVDAAFDFGLLKGGWLRRTAEGVERWLMRRFDVVSTISDRMLDRLRRKGVAPERIESFPNWVDVESIAQAAPSASLREQHGIPADAVVALYSGNMGGKQGIEVLADAAALLNERQDIVFVFCGDGGVRDKLEKRCAGLPNVRFMHLQPVEHLGALLRMADIHLLPQRAEATDLVMPSKVSGMLASGRPVVATAHPESALGRLMAGCGHVVAPGDVPAVARAVVALAADAGARARLGAHGLAYARAHLDSLLVMQRFEVALRRLGAPAASPPERLDRRRVQPEVLARVPSTPSDDGRSPPAARVADLQHP
jgi:colanic acid biosynthesis glycosyl transferase WcaI